MFYRTIQQMAQMLENLSGFIDKAEAAAPGVEGGAGALLEGRLAPDMFHLIRQVQVSADTAKLSAARLSGKEAPSHEDTETTADELRGRLRATVEYLRGFDEADFEGAATRPITLPFAKEFYSLGADYLHQFALPNFYFHVSMAYAILRHKGVDVGKRDFIGHVEMKPHAVS